MSNPFKAVLEKANELSAIKAESYEVKRAQRVAEIKDQAAEADRRMDMRYKENRVGK